ncbi:hypothetical protein ES332_D02G000900v1 [Gossypium tomentosum]|uniref:Uncharacterized protein n=1 Tax=Gossypium tomentosum TaxID=34277 RepID=A0A5D2LQL0_GOSTO|nr:hypothetical protein ES332_D02G000900v1 [Gossypium tomentosum]
MKVKVVCRKLYDYVGYDLKEIAFPSSLPDPPLPLYNCIFLMVRDIGPDLRPNDYKKDDGTEGKMEIRVGVQRQNLRSWRILACWASAYRDAVKSFIEGYQEGIQLVMEEKEDSSKAQQEGNTDKNST